MNKRYFFTALVGYMTLASILHGQQVKLARVMQTHFKPEGVIGYLDAPSICGAEADKFQTCAVINAGAAGSPAVFQFLNESAGTLMSETYTMQRIRTSEKAPAGFIGYVRGAQRGTTPGQMTQLGVFQK